MGDRDFKFFIVKSGEVETVDHSGDKPKTVVIHGKDQFTGDVAHLAAGGVRSGSIKRVASPVREGSMVVQFVHEFLKGM